MRRIGVLTQYKAQSLIRHIERGWGFLEASLGEYVDVVPAQQRLGDERWYSGTADAMYQNLDILRDPRGRARADAGWRPHLQDGLRGDAGRARGQRRRRQRGLHRGAAGRRQRLRRDGGRRQGRIVAFEEKPADPKPLPGKPGRRWSAWASMSSTPTFWSRSWSATRATRRPATTSART
jgi:glucose-1-phosphate adenylyltransferase